MSEEYWEEPFNEATAVMRRHNEGMEKIRKMIDDEMQYRHISAIRLHAILDCYAALGGDVSQWRGEDGRLK